MVNAVRQLENGVSRDLVAREHGMPECIRTDNGPEFISEKFNVWCQTNGIKHKYIQPGKPTQNSYVERFNGSYRRAILDAYIFRNIEEVRELTERWRTDYNERRPHEALSNMTPQEYKEMLLTGDIRSLGHSVPAAEANP